MSTSTSAFSLDDPVPPQADTDWSADAPPSADARQPRAVADRVLGVIGSAALATGAPPPPETGGTSSPGTTKK